MSTHPKTLHEWLDYWRERYYKPTVKASTYNISYYNLQTIKSNFPNTKLRNIDSDDCQQFLNTLYDQNYAKATIKKCNTLLKQSMDLAVKNQLIMNNPMFELTIPKAHTKIVSALTQREQEIIEYFCKSTTYGEYILFLLYTGLRVGEMISLEWNDYNPIDQTIYIRHSKTTSGIREIPLTTVAKNIIESQEKLNSDTYIFHNVHNKPLSYSCMKKCYEQLRKKTGFTNFTNHVCRHTFATRLIEKGASPKSVAALLGHKKVEFALNIYTDVEKQTLKKEIYLLEDTKETIESINQITDIITQLVSTHDDVSNKILLSSLSSLCAKLAQSPTDNF